MYPELRRQAVDELLDIGFDGYALGGLSVGEPPEIMYGMAAQTTEMLPDEYPKYMMGVGRPEDLVESVYRGVDMFDCVMPTRNARNGMLFTSSGRLVVGAATIAPVGAKVSSFSARAERWTISLHLPLYVQRESQRLQ